MPFKNKKNGKKASPKEAEFDNTNRGVLFENTDKKSKNHPDYKGSFTDSKGNEFWIAAWEKESQAGQDYLSLAFTPKETEDDEDEDEDEDETTIPVKKKSSKKK